MQSGWKDGWKKDKNLNVNDRIETQSVSGGWIPRKQRHPSSLKRRRYEGKSIDRRHRGGGGSGSGGGDGGGGGGGGGGELGRSHAGDASHPRNFLLGATEYHACLDLEFTDR
ncbi:hypothetical protein HZH66_012762 [Vespula vulgaris]|uniref:Uncharacterized protein n=1 Tax=Vespula vulgaris TaxID=7454 RepID=A0A834JA38_VESVU|nr:hypothetical protein HZH66_012762 [Vespula vulgaris]